MITVTATRHRHRDSSPRAIDPAAVVETTLLALDKMNECVDAFARRVRDAFERLKSRRARGKIVIDVA